MSPLRRRLPDYAATAPLFLILAEMGLDRHDPVDVLLAALYRLAARLERRTAPWDAQGLALVGVEHVAHLPAGRCSVHLAARIGTYADREV